VRARLNDKLHPRVVVGEYGWWDACGDLGVKGYDPFSPEGANFNGTIDATIRDPISGTPAHRANVCEMRVAAKQLSSENLVHRSSDPRQRDQK
jgi:hypothetical protein